MTNDPIVEEVRRVREQLLAEVGGDITKLLERHRQWALQHPERMVSLEDVRRIRAERERSGDAASFPK